MDQAGEKIVDLYFRELHPIMDERGELTELVRTDWSKHIDIKQVYITTCNPGVVKAWHCHMQQTDRMVCVEGRMLFAFYDDRDESVSFKQIDSLVVRAERPMLITIPTGVWHGFKNIGQFDARVINCPDQLYDYKQPDELRQKPDHHIIPFDWYTNVDG